MDEETYFVTFIILNIHTYSNYEIKVYIIIMWTCMMQWFE